MTLVMMHASGRDTIARRAYTTNSYLSHQLDLCATRALLSVS